VAWDPITPLLEKSDTVFVVPDGLLHVVNLAALPRDDGGFLIETDQVLHVLSAERDLVATSQAPLGKGLLLMGAPAFKGSRPRVARHSFRGTTADCEGFRRMRFSPLPAAKQELKIIGALWRENAATDAEDSSLVSFQGADADEAAFKDNAAGRRIIHLATHGFVLGRECGQSSDNPLLRSGLALAGANQRGKAGPDVEDGILTAEEIAALDLAGVKWAVLSACNTGSGEITAGEGVFGLRRAFQVAGTRSVIMSLWPVDDASARAWMANLYRRRLRDRLSTAEAVRQASLDALQHRRGRGQSIHPLYWAGFVAAGDWR
jgi:CHAT domain-containing protein